jgi:hypothetical protein
LGEAKDDDALCADDFDEESTQDIQDSMDDVMCVRGIGWFKPHVHDGRGGIQKGHRLRV